MGLVRYGVLKVLSTIKGMPLSWAILEIASRSAISSAGFETDSTKKARVLASIALRKFSGSVLSTKRTVMPKPGRMSLN